MTFSFRAHERLKRPDDFLKARRVGTKRVGRQLVLWARHRHETPARATRLGIVVSRKNGGAVQRNRFKRRMREIFRLNKHGLARGWDIVFAPKAKSSSASFPPDFAELAADFLRLTAPMKIEQDPNPKGV